MIIVRINGGLGNQLFQYSLGRSLALRHGSELRFDISLLEDKADRAFYLTRFETAGSMIQASEMSTLLRRPNLLERLFPALRRPYVRRIHEHTTRFDPTVLETSDNVFLDGYWQSELYFRNVKSEIRRDLTIQEPPTGRNKQIAGELSESNSVGLHVRRGDYVAHPVASRILGFCGLDYYRRAVDRIAETVESPRYYVFSDDPEWCRHHLQLGAPTKILDHNPPDEPHEDLRLMSLCRHHVIANSTFSWWGAWLAEGDGRANVEDRIVIAPKRWYRSTEHSSDDLVPDRWLRL